MIATPNATRFGPCMSGTKLPEWDRVLSAAAHLQTILPDAVLVGGSASAVHAGHRMSVDADHVLTDLRSRFDAILTELESVAGWKTARIQRPVQILGKLDGIETGIRQLIRDAMRFEPCVSKIELLERNGLITETRTGFGLFHSNR